LKGKSHQWLSILLQNWFQCQLAPLQPGDISAWLDKFKTGALTPSMKSEEPPAQNLGSVKAEPYTRPLFSST
jgi:hypothetical protein